MGNSIRKALSKQEEDFSFRNGELILQQLIADFDGKSLPLRVFSLEELDEATDGFDSSRYMAEGALSTLYRGNFDGRLISVKKFNDSFLKKERVLEKIINEVVIASQIGKHQNVLKLLGYCPGPELPVLVYEHSENGNLSQYIYRDSKQVLPWDSRLRILSELANTFAFLHCGTSRVVIHGNINPYNIFLDKNFNPKLCDFIYSKLILLGEDHIKKDIMEGTWDYFAPEVEAKGRYSEKSDAYNFGFMVLDELTMNIRFTKLLGLSMIAQDPYDFLSAAYIAGGEGSTQQQIGECVELIRRCLMTNPVDRPTMIEVAKSLRKIRSLNDQSLQQNT